MVYKAVLTCACVQDGSGQIDQQELGDMLSDLGMRVSKADTRKMFLEADTDGGGYIDFDEFLAIFKKADAGENSVWQQASLLVTLHNPRWFPGSFRVVTRPFSMQFTESVSLV